MHLAFLLRGCVKTNQWFAVFAAGLVACGSVNCFIWVQFRGRKKKWCLRHQGVDESLILSICCSLSPFNPGDSFGGLKVKHPSIFHFSAVFILKFIFGCQNTLDFLPAFCKSRKNYILWTRHGKSKVRRWFLTTGAGVQGTGDEQREENWKLLFICSH